MDPLNNPTPNPTPNPNPVPEPPKPGSAMPPLEPASSPALETSSPNPVVNPAMPPMTPNSVGAPTPTNPIINPSGMAPASPASQLGGLGIAATDPIMMAEPPKAPDPVEEELKAPMRAAEPVPGSIGSAVSGPANGMTPGGVAPEGVAPMDGGAMNPVQNVAFNDPAAGVSPNGSPAPGLELNSAANGKKSPFAGFGKMFQEKKTMVILIAVAAVIAVILLIVLIVMMSGSGNNSNVSVPDSPSGQNPNNSGNGEELEGTVACVMTPRVFEDIVDDTTGDETTTLGEVDRFVIDIKEGEFVSVTTYMTTIDESGNSTVNTSTEPYSAELMDFSIMQDPPFDRNGIVTVDSLEEFATSFQDAFGQLLEEMAEIACEVE